MRKNRHSFILMIVMAIVPLFCSCDGVTRIENRRIVNAVGIDKGENKKYSVCFQVFQPSGSGANTPIDTSQANMKLVTIEADTVAQAVNQCEVSLGKYLFTGHNKLIVLGSDLLNEPITEILDYFIQNEQSYLGIPVVASHTKASDILSVELTSDTVTAEALESLIKISVINGTATPNSLLLSANALEEPDGSLAFPVFTVSDENGTEKSPSGGSGGGGGGNSEGQKEDKQPLLNLTHTDIVKNGKKVCKLDKSETMGLCWLNNTSKSSKVSINLDEKIISLEVRPKLMSSDIEKNGDEIHLRYALNFDLTVLDDVNSDSNKEKIQELCADEIKKNCTAAFEKSVKQNSCDVLRIFSRIRNKYPKLFLQSIDDYSKLLQNCTLKLSVNCKLN